MQNSATSRRIKLGLLIWLILWLVLKPGLIATNRHELRWQPLVLKNLLWSYDPPPAVTSLQTYALMAWSAEMADGGDERVRSSCGAHETSLPSNSSQLVWVPPRVARLVSHEFPEPKTRLAHDETGLKESRS
jgi:hypothetical protein